MNFQQVIRTAKLVNASTFPIRVSGLKHMDYRVDINVEPLGVVEVPYEWTQRNEDHRGRKVLRSTIEQYAPHLVPEGDPRIKEAQSVIKTGQYLPAGAQKPIETAVYPLPPKERDPAVIVQSQQARP